MDMQAVLGWSDKHLKEARSCGYLYYKQGAYDIAKKIFQMLIAIDPNNVYDQLMLGSIFLELEDAQAALENLDFVLKTDPENKHSLFLRFKTLLLLQKNKQAQDMASILMHTDYRSKIVALCKTYHLPLPF